MIKTKTKAKHNLTPLNPFDTLDPIWPKWIKLNQIVIQFKLIILSLSNQSLNTP